MCLPVFIEISYQHQNDVNWDLLDNMGVLILFSASILCDMYLSVFTKNGHLHQNDVNRNLIIWLYSSHSQLQFEPKNVHFRCF
jgi:hypothetical protein